MLSTKNLIFRRYIMITVSNSQLPHFNNSRACGCDYFVPSPFFNGFSQCLTSPSFLTLHVSLSYSFQVLQV
ncbi:Uncharacterized protein HZ326_26163 [Fusarium oxysporum f. sp. albedinis]|nr:Uncharacterized protein HZ326_26163 [Fusarium oxysporum f. sp. albedinis]